MSNKARVFIFALGVILIVSIFSATLLIPHTHETLHTNAESALPPDVHIPININTADKDTLCLLEDIGDTLAENIIAYREEQGSFQSKEDIVNVSGIGEKTYAKIKNYICAE